MTKKNEKKTGDFYLTKEEVEDFVKNFNKDLGKNAKEFEEKYGSLRRPKKVDTTIYY